MTKTEEKTEYKNPFYDAAIDAVMNLAVKGENLYCAVLSGGIEMRGKAIGSLVFVICGEEPSGNALALIDRSKVKDEELGPITSDKAIELIKRALVL